MTKERVPYAGIATRAVALGIDAALAHLIVLALGGLFALVGSLVGGVSFSTLAGILSAIAWAAVVGLYFVCFWTLTGQTPGMRVMRLRVVGPGGEPPHAVRSVVRVIGLALAIAPLFLGFVPVLIDDRRRALQDMLARTVVLYVEEPAAASAEPA